MSTLPFKYTLTATQDHDDVWMKLEIDCNACNMGSHSQSDFVHAPTFLENLLGGNMAG